MPSSPRRLLLPLLLRSSSPPTPPRPEPPIFLEKVLFITFGAFFVSTALYFLFNACFNRLIHYLRLEQPTAGERALLEAQATSCKIQLRAIPVRVYRSPPGSEAECCSVCLGEYEEGEQVRAMPVCQHVFHKDCVDEWLINRSSFCPVCRARIVMRPVEPSKLHFEVAGHGHGHGHGHGDRWRREIDLANDLASARTLHVPW